MTDNEIRAAWLESGGSFYGPIVETATIPEAKMFTFVRGLIAAEREACANVCEASEDTGDARGIEQDVFVWNRATRYCAIAIRKRSN